MTQRLDGVASGFRYRFDFFPRGIFHPCRNALSRRVRCAFDLGFQLRRHPHAKIDTKSSTNLHRNRPVQSGQSEKTMNVKYLGYDKTDEIIIGWYDIDGVTYGHTSDGKILDSDGAPLVNDSNARWAIERFEATKSPN